MPGSEMTTETFWSQPLLPYMFSESKMIVFVENHLRGVTYAYILESQNLCVGSFLRNRIWDLPGVAFVCHCHAALIVSLVAMNCDNKYSKKIVLRVRTS